MSKAFEELKQYLQEDMRLQHIYQPVFIKTILENSGSATAVTIAKNILEHDQSQIDYYEYIVKNTPSSVLKKHEIVERDGNLYQLHSKFKDLTQAEARLLSAYCDEEIAKFLMKHGDAPFSHRNRNREPISGSLRYQLITRAKGRCEACGISSSERPLDVDHIIPKNKGGSDDESNLQILCKKCNTQKRDTDDTDFQKVKASYEERDKKCVFCNLPDKKIIDSNELAIAFYDNYPVTEYHTLIIPKRHVDNYFELYQPELNAINELAQRQQDRLLKKDVSITGFNVGINIGRDAGQSIFHVHMHLIPRRKGDMNNPKGGVRGVIPEKQKY